MSCARPVSVPDRRARIAVAALFLTNGAVFANLLPRYPEIKTDLALTNAVYGVIVAAFAAGALVAGLAAGAIIRRAGSARAAVVSTVAMAVLILAAGFATTPVVLGAALFAAGACDAVTDVAQNAHGLRVQQHYRRSIINSLHAVWAAGAILGGLMGAAAIALDIGRATHLGISAALFATVAITAYPHLLPGPDHVDDGREHAEAGLRPGFAVYAALAALIGIATAGAVIEDAGSSWATLYMRDGVGAPGAVAVTGYLALMVCMFVGRLTGDRLVDRFGERTLARAGGLLIAVGMGAALAFPSVPGTVAGFAAVGLGVATLVPAAMHGADSLPGLRRGTGLTAVAWLMRVGFVASPPVVGLIADAAGLRAGLLLVPVAGLLVAMLAGVLSARRPSRS
ncbi:MFS transporter [Mycolicibacterium diernhoferi]|uniref:MFS transporter n=2 Tax=Mycolicibacterium diernhoferi TaxID=1801 RepID=A0A1Q4H8V1_9MYCO|nr:MFS transporter [Mycolicibacterium diernhoferi]OJZ63976.1 MFS transporter [Mycolicibacterium diernhoferi]PEG55640.1 MFS transporter [Mycolicibacterium diernhoferi]QYL20664.1 MFS transporter [Mycolicibacterium diernhoferi]